MYRIFEMILCCVCMVVMGGAYSKINKYKLAYDAPYYTAQTEGSDGMFRGYIAMSMSLSCQSTRPDGALKPQPSDWKIVTLLTLGHAGSRADTYFERSEIFYGYSNLGIYTVKLFTRVALGTGSRIPAKDGLIPLAFP